MDRGVSSTRQLLRYTTVILYIISTHSTGYLDVYKALAGSVLLTTGEHEYTRYGYLQLLQQRCVDIIQPDITWMGGITEVWSLIDRLLLVLMVFIG